MATVTGSTLVPATNATNVNITDDTATNSTHYVHFGDATTGYDGVKVSSSKLTFNPSTGSLQVGGLQVATTADLTAASSPNFSVDSANFGTANSFTIGEGKAVYYDTTTSKWEGAYNDSTGEYTASHIIVDMAATDVKIASTGIFTLSGLSANNYYFLSSTAGTTTIDPDSSPTAWQPLYYALDANTIDLQIQTPEDTVIGTFGSNATISSGGVGGGLSALVEDTTPQLGGDLDLNSQNITGTGDISITGKVASTVGTNARTFTATDGTQYVSLVADLGNGGYNGLSTAGDVGIIFTTDGNAAADEAGKGLVIAPWASGAKGMKIQEDGKVGIGTTSPTTTLDVDGTITDDVSDVRTPRVTNISTATTIADEGVYYVTNNPTVTLGAPATGTIMTLYNSSGSSMTLARGTTVVWFRKGADNDTVSHTSVTLGAYSTTTVTFFSATFAVVTGTDVT